MTTLPLPIIMENDGKYIAAWCPVLDIATQGRDEKEARKNMGDLVKWYFEDKDTTKPKIKTMMNLSISMTNIPVSIPKTVKC
jgi:predicted RNase H-like HicB family nuclease